MALGDDGATLAHQRTGRVCDGRGSGWRRNCDGRCSPRLAALERDAGGSAEAHALGALDDLEETRKAIGEAYGDERGAPENG